jgi:hypothetical protein
LGWKVLFEGIGLHLQEGRKSTLLRALEMLEEHEMK